MSYHPVPAPPPLEPDPIEIRWGDQTLTLRAQEGPTIGMFLRGSYVGGIGKACLHVHDGPPEYLVTAYLVIVGAFQVGWAQGATRQAAASKCRRKALAAFRRLGSALDYEVEP